METGRIVVTEEQLMAADLCSVIAALEARPKSVPREIVNLGDCDAEMKNPLGLLKVDGLTARAIVPPDNKVRIR